MNRFATAGRLLALLAFLAAPALAHAQDPGIVLDTGVASFEFFANGELGGYADSQTTTFGTGFVFDGDNGLYEGTLLVGTDFDQVSGEAYEYLLQEWVTVAPVSVATPPSGFDEAASSAFDDSNALSGAGPLGVQVTAMAFSDQGDPFVITEFEVQNTSTTDDLTGVYIGIFADWDVGEFAQNLGDYDADNQILYVWDNSGTNTKYYGVAALDPPDGDVDVTGVSFDALPGDAILFGGLSVIQSPSPNPADRRTVIGVGPFDIPAGASQQAAFAFVGGADEAAVIANAAAAQVKYDATILSAIEPGPDGTPGTHALSAPAPNPFSARASFDLEVAATQNVRVSVYDALGREVAVVHDGALVGGTVHTLELDATSLPSGVYLVRVAGEQFNATRQITLAR